MRTLVKARLVLCIVLVVAVIGVTTGFAEDQTSEAGDPGNINPGMSTLEPTPAILSGLITVLVTVVSLALP